jgi:hypothetical protein
VIDYLIRLCNPRDCLADLLDVVPLWLLFIGGQGAVLLGMLWGVAWVLTMDWTVP